MKRLLVVCTSSSQGEEMRISDKAGSVGATKDGGCTLSGKTLMLRSLSGNLNLRLAPSIVTLMVMGESAPIMGVEGALEAISA